MKLAGFAVKNRAFSYFVAVIVAIAGIASFFELGQLEDPAFAVKNAVVSVRYPGASPEEVELEVADRIEIALQELPQLDYVESWSRPGEVLIAISIRDEYWADQLPQVWDELRRKINDVRVQMPPGVEEPVSPARTDWRERTSRLEPRFNQERARWASITRDDIARATQRAFDGRTIGLYREDDEMRPIVLRQTADERKNFTTIDGIQVQPAGATKTVPLLQVTDGVPVVWEDPIIGRRDRRRTITVQANPIQGVTLPTLRDSLLEEFAALEDRLPPGYTMEWGGEYEDTVNAQAGLIPGITPTVIIILLIIVGLFNAYRPPLVILLTVPFVVIGISWGLLIFNVPFGFVALLGAMSLVGMMIKNAIVLLDECNVQLEEGKNRYDAINYAALSRLRPVALAAATTVLGVVPLLKDVFWVGLSVTIMAGLSFGTLLTMFLVPVLYSTIYKLRPGGDPAPVD